MADPNTNDYHYEEEEDDGDEEIDETNYKSQKDALLLAIDISKSMLAAPPNKEDSKKTDRTSAALAALKCAYQLMQQRIISHPKDMMGILLFGTQKSKFQEESTSGHKGLAYPHCYLFTDLDVPAADDVKALKNLVEEGEDPNHVLKPTTEPVAMSNVLFCANQIFTTNAPNFGSRRLFIITDNDHPHAGDKQAQTAAAVRAKDLYDLGVIIDVFPISHEGSNFDLTKFYDDIIYRDPAGEANMTEIKTSQSDGGLKLLNSLISNINSKQTPKRSMFSNLPFEIAPGFKISVKGYNIIHRQVPVRSCYVWLDGEKAQIAVGENTRIAEDTARTVEKTETKKAYKFGGEYVYFTPEEQKALKDFGPPTIRIIGFKKRSVIPMWASVKKSTFIFPSEEGYVGSTRVFSSLWRKLLKDEKVGIAWYVPRVNAVPLLVAIMPSKERSDEESGTPYLPAGLWLYPLPYADDLRPSPDLPPVIRASDPLIDKMRTIVQQLQLPKGIYNPTKYPNPSLQWFYKILQTMALEEEVPQKLDDPTVPKYSAISKRAGGYMDDWKVLLKQDQEAAIATHKPKREVESEAIKVAKRPKTTQMSESGLSNIQLKAAAEDGGLSKLLVSDLKDILGARGLSTAGRKVELVDRIEQWLESNT